MCDSMKASRVCCFLRLSVVLWCLLLYGHCRSWDSCLVPGPVIVTLPIGLSCVLFFAFVRRIVVSSVVFSFSAVGLLFSPCIVIAARVGFLFRILVLSVVV